MLEVIKKLKNHHNGSKAFMVYVFILNNLNDKKELNVRQSDLQAELDFSLPTIRECLRTLKEEGLISFGYGFIKVN